MPQVGITYEEVARVAASIAARGERPSNRSVRAELGTGSMGTISRYMSKWLEAQPEPKAKRHEIPAALIESLNDEIDRQAAADKADLNAQISTLKGDKAALEEENAFYEEARDTLAAELELAKAKTEQQVGIIEQLRAEIVKTEAEATEAIAKAQADAADAVAKANAELLKERADAISARQELARAELRLEALPHLQAEIQRIQDKLDGEASHVKHLEKTLAVAEVEKREAIARAEAADKRESEAQKAHQVALEKASASAEKGHKAEMAYSELVGKVSGLEREILAERESAASWKALAEERNAKATKAKA